MGAGDDQVQFVVSSSVRSDVLQAVADGATTTEGLLDVVDASSSAVYDALGRLEEVGLLQTAGDNWAVTGSGQVIADYLAERGRLEALLGESGGYLATHDAQAIPERFRQRISELAGGQVRQAPATEPQGVVREIRTHLDSTDYALIVTPIYDEAYTDVMPTHEQTRIVADTGIVASEVRDADESEAPGEDDYESTSHWSIRVTNVAFSMVVTESALLLSLPLLDGSYDTQTEFVADHERARRWGRELFEELWADAQPLEDYVNDTYL